MGKRTKEVLSAQRCSEVPHRWDFSGTSIQGHLSRGLIDVMRLTLLLLVSYRPLAHLCNTDPISASCEAPVA